MKKLAALALAGVMAVSVAACGSGSSAGSSASSSAETSADTQTAASEAAEDTEAVEEGTESGSVVIDTSVDDRLTKILEQGYIEVVTEPYFAPFEFIDPSKTGDDQYVGMDMEVAKYIADKLGVDLKIVPLEFSAVLASITEGKYDLAISAIAYSPERAEAMNLSKGYYLDTTRDNSYGFAVRAEDADKYTSIEDLKDAVVATQSGSVQEGLFNEYITKDNCKELKLFSSMTDAFLAVTEGKADVCICANENANLYGEANDGKLVTTGFKFDCDPDLASTRIGAPLKDSDRLMEVVNECIDELNAKDQTIEWYSDYAEYAKSLGLD